jgi:hypothetical protein
VGRDKEVFDAEIYRIISLKRHSSRHMDEGAALDDKEQLHVRGNNAVENDWHAAGQYSRGTS